ncbi:MAG: hypothetical protein QOI56_2131 [Actinomycetota bacterium]|nr:hypothetical protein [Actinomycetota bacterium]
MSQHPTGGAGPLIALTEVILRPRDRSTPSGSDATTIALWSYRGYGQDKPETRSSDASGVTLSL